MLILFFLSQAGYHIIFAIRQYEIKEEVTHRLLASMPENLLDVIDADLNKDHIEWEEEDREFFLNGQMYDVAYIKNMNGKKLIYCLNDVKEEKFLSHLAKITGKQADQSGNDPSHQNIKFDSPDLILFAQTDSEIAATYEQPHFVYSNELASVTIEIPTPPPDINQKCKTGII